MDEDLPTDAMGAGEGQSRIDGRGGKMPVHCQWMRVLTGAGTGSSVDCGCHAQSWGYLGKDGEGNGRG